MLTLVLGWLVAIIAITSQPTAPPDRFTGGMLARGESVVSSTFVGIEWDCGGRYDETCFVGLSDGLLVTGP